MLGRGVGIDENWFKIKDRFVESFGRTLFWGGIVDRKYLSIDRLKKHGPNTIGQGLKCVKSFPLYHPVFGFMRMCLSPH